MSHDNHVCKDCDPKCVSEAIEIAKERILSGEYVYCRPNEGRFSVKNKGNPYNFDHECLLWGIDCDKETFQTSSYIEGNYVAYEISFDELYDCLLYTSFRREDFRSAHRLTISERDFVLRLEQYSAQS